MIEELDESNPLRDLIAKLSQINPEDPEVPVMVHISQGRGPGLQGKVFSVHEEEDAVWINAYDVHET